MTISGEPRGTTTDRNATLMVGYHRTGGSIPATGWPEGLGYTHYKWRLDGGAWSAETPISTPINLTSLVDGQHFVEAVGKRDSGLYQDDPIFGEDAVVSRSATWTVTGVAPLSIESISSAGGVVTIHFNAEARRTYSLLRRDALDESHPWTKAQDVAAQPASGTVTLTETADASSRFYEVVSPAVP